MGRQIIIKENNEIAVWSSIVDDFIFEGDVSDYIKIRVDEVTEETTASIKTVYDGLLKGEKVYYQFQMTYKEACELRDLNKKGE